MIGYVLRRLAGSLLVLLASTFVCYLLVAHSGDPLADLRMIRDPAERAARQAERAAALDLDTPPVLRYLGWLQGVAGCLLPGRPCTLGTDRSGRQVSVLLGQAMTSTLSLVAAALLLAMLLGVIGGVVSALRRGTALDHGLGAAAVVCYATPPFFLAVLVKETGAVDLNTWLADPRVPVPALPAVAALNGLVWAAVLGGPVRRRALVFTVAAATAAGVLAYLGAVRWFADPALGPAAVGLGAAAAGMLALALAGCLGWRTAAAAAAVGVVSAVLLVAGDAWLAAATNWSRPGLATVGLVLTGAVAGALAGGPRRPQTAGSLAAGGAAGACLLITDHLLRAVPGYRALRDGLLVPTFGDLTPGAPDGFWGGVLDQQVHLLLPSLTLCLLSLATYLRYTRAAMVEALAGDYVLAARSWGLGERQVVLGHALRNALLPVVTVVTLDCAAVFGGAVIIEDVFGWRGMGALFATGPRHTDPAPVMAFVLVSGAALVVCTAAADVLYGLLDPRVRL